MNCSFCARAGAASAATPTSDTSTIPIRFPIIGSSIKNNVSRSGPKPTRGSVKPSGTLVAAGVHFKLKISKPREQLVGNRYGNRSTGGLVAIAMREGWLLGPRHSYTRGKKASTTACFVRLPGARVAFAAHAPFKVLHQRFRFPQVRCVKAFCELLVDRLHQL